MVMEMHGDLGRHFYLRDILYEMICLAQRHNENNIILLIVDLGYINDIWWSNELIFEHIEVDLTFFGWTTYSDGRYMMMV